MELRKTGKAAAWLQFQSDLMNNFHLLSPLILSPKDLIATVQDIEEFIKGATDQHGKSPGEMLREFLSQGTVDGSPLTPASSVIQTAVEGGTSQQSS